jgi:hypothetical protein
LGAQVSLSLCACWTQPLEGTIYRKVVTMLNQPDLLLRHTRSALIGMTALAYSVFISLVVLLSLSEPVNAEMAVFTVGVLGFALGLTVALVVVSQASEQDCKGTFHG